MLNFLVCPFDKETELELFEVKSRNIGKRNSYKDISDNINLKRKEITKSKQQRSTDYTYKNENNNGDIIKEILEDDSDSTVIIEGILFCNSCSRFYPIVEEIPVILPDNLRDKNKDLEFLKKWSHDLPEKIIKNALPWHL
jgi:uncharacterized protein YbaR (Trm112 family)